MMTIKLSNFEIQTSVRKGWGKMNPGTKVYKSQKDYNRKDKSWKKMED